jgi:hypothetical protein
VPFARRIAFCPQNHYIAFGDFVMRAEIVTLAAEIKQSMELLRRHL